ncbi:PREDICTED: protein REVEILLE 6-like [Tarenaya hassleriana]|uniref:protein REVEILLE 6-like n=1 Tax=Tarenaya hassleriana TaxID=28532 RepID=UPI00053C383C|nr:PREDICTED: protein REVEILLE 6-like [Tarenaya hassleriana]XP_010521358.1 PREDICTED: protein REVEILLE 6-like [Tarenaya hassleriana]
MVSPNPNPGGDFYLDPTGMTSSSLGPSPAAATTTTSSAVAAGETATEDPSKKVRKPYTITKSRESWTEPEHDKFLEALQLFDRDWKKIEAFIGSKTVIQIRSHAQKYFLKVQKSGTGEHLPPPRPKRKASHPYPQKAPKNAQPQASGSLKSTPGPSEPGFMFRPESSPMLMNSENSADVAPSWTNNNVQTISFSPVAKGSVATNNCSSSSKNTPRTLTNKDTNDQGYHAHSLRVLPDFAQVYNFIGSVFDPYATEHLQKLKEMDPIDVETVLLLMRNLSINLASPDFEDHRQLLSCHDISSETADHVGGTSKTLNKGKPEIST